MHALEAVPEGEQVGGDRTQVVGPEKRVDFAGIERTGWIRGHGQSLRGQVNVVQPSCAGSGLAPFMRRAFR